jgi:hypothetical protein
MLTANAWEEQVRCAVLLSGGASHFTIACISSAERDRLTMRKSSNRPAKECSGWSDVSSIRAWNSPEAEEHFERPSLLPGAILGDRGRPFVDGHQASEMDDNS